MNKFNLFCETNQITLSELRKDILFILHKNQKPISAYEILEELKNKRPKAKPPTVYRVLKWLINKNLIHRIESENTYILCSKLNKKETHKNILLLCLICKTTYEIEARETINAIKKFAFQYQFLIDDTILELKGHCNKCQQTLHTLQRQ